MKGMTGLLLLFAMTASIRAATYEVGPGREYAELGNVPWLTLSAGDTVLIHWRQQPYASKIFLRASGTASQPVVIKGVPNPDGQLPVISGENATTAPQFAGYFSSQWTEDLGLILIDRNRRVPPADSEEYKPSHIVIESLALTGAKPGNTFTDQFGNTRNYNNFSSAIHALVVDNLTVRHCKIYDNAQGIFTNSNGNTEGYISRNTLIEYNEIWGNGNADENGKEHNVYIQSAGTIIQYNYMGRLRPGSVGANIKDRSSGTVIRYNWIEGAARMIDLVETEDAWEIIMQEPNYHDVYVYGNVLVNDMTQEPFGVNLIHFGHDNSPVEAKRGTLYFYHNTVHIKGNTDIYWYNRLFDVTTDDGKVALYNNIIYKEGTTYLELMRDKGTLTFYGNNWIQQGYTELAYQSDAAVVYEVQPQVGTDPGFVSASSHDYRLAANSSCINAAAALPEALRQDHPADRQYMLHASSVERPVIGSAADLGAFETDIASSVPAPPVEETVVPAVRLRQNYPNPFNPSTKIAYAIPDFRQNGRTQSTMAVELKIFDMRGREVAVLVQAEQKPGEYEVVFDAGDLPAGLYFYRLRAGNFSTTRRLLLLR